MKELIDKKIKEISCDVYDWTPAMYDETLAYAKAQTLNPDKAVSVSIAVLKFLFWVKDNLIVDGKLKMPLWKWPSIIYEIRELIKNIVK